MSLYIIGNVKNRRFFSISGRIVSKNGTLLTRVGITALSEARAVIETQGSKIPPEDTLLFEMEQKSKKTGIIGIGMINNHISVL